MRYISKLPIIIFLGLASATLSGCDSTNEANNSTESGLALPESGGRPNDDLSTNQGRTVVRIDDIKGDPARVRDFESALKAKGFDPGPIDGKWDSSTQDAFNEFKSANGIEGDSLNSQALKALGLDRESARSPANAK